MAALTEDEFDKRYNRMAKPEEGTDPAEFDEDEDGVLLWEFEDVQDKDIHHVWTVVESGDPDNENLYLRPGITKVNVVGYAVTEHPWETGEEEGIYFDYAEMDQG